ncbi:MAG: BON domain-containing protein [Pseudomonadota bacterium]
MPPSGKTDDELREDVLCQMAWDERLNGQQIGVQVQHGVVTLGGVVDLWVQFNAAAEAAHQVAEVTDVANEIQVRASAPDAPTDTDLAVAVRRALRWDGRIHETDIRSTVAGGIVTLEGIVASAAQRAEATRAVARLHGVRRVDNRLVVGELSP